MRGERIYRTDVRQLPTRLRRECQCGFTRRMSTKTTMNAMSGRQVAYQSSSASKQPWHNTSPRQCSSDVQFDTKCAALVVQISALLTAHLCSYNFQQCDARTTTSLGELTALRQTSWLDFGERKRMGKGSGKGKG